jgi:uncharacterized protein HemX
MPDTQQEAIEPPDRPAKSRKNGYNWPNLIAGGLTGLASIGAGIALFSSGQASRSAATASRAEYVTMDVAHSAKARLDAFESEQKQHDTQLETMDKRIEANLHRITAIDHQAAQLEKRLTTLEEKILSDLVRQRAFAPTPHP